MTAQGLQEERRPVTFRYAFRFLNGEETVVNIALDPKTLDLIEPAILPGARSSALGVCQSAQCPLKRDEQPTCPAVVGLEDIVKLFGGHRPEEQVEVSIDAESRTYMKRTSLQQAVTSLVGILMVASGCPVLGKLKPMVRYHLPFATLEETQCRVIGMYLLAQYLRARQGQSPDWKLRNLVQMYKDIQAVNEHFVKRLSHGSTQDPSLNALVILQAFSYAIAFSIDRNLLDEIAVLFKAYYEDVA
jgi:hypothetical protein